MTKKMKEYVKAQGYENVSRDLLAACGMLYNKVTCVGELLQSSDNIVEKNQKVADLVLELSNVDVIIEQICCLLDVEGVFDFAKMRQYEEIKKKIKS